MEVSPVARTNRGVYFIGRLVWDKGFSDLIELSRRLQLPIDVYGDGPDAAAIKKQSRQRGALLRFHGATIAPWKLLEKYRVFLNPSRSEVLCTATADALVAGRHVVLPQCLANQPFLRYPNSHAYHDLDEAEALLLKALEEQPISPNAARHNFDWRNACRRLAGLCADPPLV
jgi:digalactosyldiacylglycerol synthase